MLYFGWPFFFILQQYSLCERVYLYSVSLLLLQLPTTSNSFTMLKPANWETDPGFRFWYVFSSFPMWDHSLSLGVCISMCIYMHIYISRLLIISFSIPYLYFILTASSWAFLLLSVKMLPCYFFLYPLYWRRPLHTTVRSHEMCMMRFAVCIYSNIYHCSSWIYECVCVFCFSCASSLFSQNI